MHRKKGRMNLLIMLIIIVVIDLLFIGYQSVTKHDKESSHTSNMTTYIVKTSQPTFNS